MKIDEITALHADLLQGIDIRELSDKALLRYGSILLKQFRQSKSVLRKIKVEDFNKTQHWVLVREHCNVEIDAVLSELKDRMALDPELFADGMLLNFAELVGSIRVAIFDEEQLDNASVETEETDDVELIFDDEQ